MSRKNNGEEAAVATLHLWRKGVELAKQQEVDFSACYDGT